ncbi:MAG TPA: HEAT repeat domain-containing protein [Pyrinomonadaceae bacterium]
MTKITEYFSRARMVIALLFLVGLLAAIGLHPQRVYGLDQDIAKLNRFAQASKSNPAAMKTFQEGRDLIESQNWQGAAEKFNDFIKGFPKDKDLDAALYWYGYALQKQNLKDQAKVPLIKLINNFPNSSWRREAEALLVYLGEQNLVKDKHYQENCEIKILALQSLFQADEERAIGIVTESLKSNVANQCQGFQAAAVSVLGSHGGPRVLPILLDVAKNNSDLKLRLTAIKRLGEQQNDQVTDELIKIYDTDRTKEIRSQVLRALVQNRTSRGTAKVLEVAGSGDDPVARVVAIKYIGDLKDTNSLDALIRIYDTDKTPQVRSLVLQALSDREEPRARAKLLEIAKSGETPELRLEAIRRLGGHGRVALDDLLQLYSSETNIQIKQGLLRAFVNSKDPRAVAKLLEIASGHDPIELRAAAIRQLGNKDDEQTVTQLVAIYDSEQNMQLRGSLLRAFGDSKQKIALQKLMSIARNDPSVELRKMAVNYLGQSKDPEALKFLEELLK